MLLRKAFYPHEYIDDWKKFNEATLPEKEEFYSKLNMEEITNADYIHGKRVCKDFEIKDLGEYHDLYLKSDTLLLADVFQNFWKMCLKIYQLDPAIFLLHCACISFNSSSINMASSFKKDRSKIRIINRHWYAING